MDSSFRGCFLSYMQMNLEKRHRESLRVAVDRVVMENLDYLVRFAFFKVGDKEVAEDLVHDAILRFLEKEPADVDAAKLRMYLYRIVYNLCTGYLSKGGWAERWLHSPLDSCDFAACPESEIIEKEEVARINNLLDSLSDKESDVIRMNVVDGLSFVEISEILDTPVTTVKSRFKAGMERLRKQYFKTSE